MGHWDSQLRESARQSIAGHSSHGSAAPLRSPAMRAVLRRLEELAPCDGATVMIEGESGTGKSYLARALHRASPRSKSVFVELDLGTLHDELASSELFGHVPGAFTGARSPRKGLVAAAHTGTLFLDEFGKASRPVQGRLLTLLERRIVRPVGSDREIPVDVRFIVATNVALETLVTTGQMIPDLLPRLSAFRILVPPLRERQGDISALAQACIEQRYKSFGYDHVPSINEDLINAMERAPWPYNIRELDNVIQRLLVAARGARVLGLDHCHGDDLIFLRRLALVGDSELSLTPERAADAVITAGSISQAARDLGVARSTIQRQIRRATGPGPHQSM